MIFGLLFILAFIIGWLSHWFSRRWWLAVLVPTVLYLLNTLFDAQANWPLALLLGLPIVSVGGLLGAYVIETRSADASENEDLCTNNERGSE